MHGGPLGELQEIGQGGHGAKLAGKVLGGTFLWFAAVR